MINWQTGFSERELQKCIEDEVTYEHFFRNADLNPNVHLITGMICGYRIEEIENPLTQQVRYLDKLVDELAKGRKNGENPAEKVSRQTSSSKKSQRSPRLTPQCCN